MGGVISNPYFTPAPPPEWTAEGGEHGGGENATTSEGSVIIPIETTDSAGEAGNTWTAPTTTTEK